MHTLESSGKCIEVVSEEGRPYKIGRVGPNKTGHGAVRAGLAFLANSERVV
jgi:hypothetical protein